MSRIETPAIASMVCANSPDVANSRKRLGNSAILGSPQGSMLLNYAASMRLSPVQSGLQTQLILNQNRLSRVPRDRDTLPRLRANVTPDVATEMKQFPYMELLDSILAPQDY